MAHGTTIEAAAVETRSSLHEEALDVVERVRRLEASIDCALRALDERTAGLGVDELVDVHEASGALALVAALAQIRRAAAGGLR
jgi:hypothetical protein